MAGEPGGGEEPAGPTEGVDADPHVVAATFDEKAFDAALGVTGQRRVDESAAGRLVDHLSDAARNRQAHPPEAEAEHDDGDRAQRHVVRPHRHPRAQLETPRKQLVADGVEVRTAQQCRLREPLEAPR